MTLDPAAATYPTSNRGIELQPQSSLFSATGFFLYDGFTSLRIVCRYSHGKLSVFVFRNLSALLAR